MQAPSLHFTFSHPVAALQEFIPLLLNLGLFIYVFFYFPHNKLTRLFYLFLVPLSIWQLTDLMVHLSADKESAYFWYFLFSPVLNLIAPLAMHFSLVFTRHKDWLKSRALLFSLYFPAIIFVFLSYAGVINFSVHPSPFWGWLIIGNDSIVDLINAWWIVILSIVTLSLLVHHAFKTRNENKNSRKQAKLVAIGISIPTIIGIITEFIFPFLLKTEPIPLLSTTLSAFSVCVLIALRKYELLSFSPRHAWTNIMKNMKEGLLIVNNEDEIEFANDHFCRMTGYTEKELLHKKAANLLLDENERARIDEKIWDRKHQVSEKYEIAIRKKNGDLIWCMISGTPFFDRQGNVIGSIGMHSDITDKKKADKALLESESRLRFFVEESLLCIYSFVPKTKKILHSNKAFNRLMGYTPAELRECLVYDLVNHPKESVDNITEEILQNKKYNAEERQWKRKDGKVIDVLVSFVYMQNEGEEIIYVAAQDITESKELEKSLNQKIRDLNIFIYQVSHDIKGPLSSILGLTNIALSETEHPEQRNYFSMIAQSTKRLDNTLMALMDIIVITQGKLKYQPIDLHQELKEIKHNLAYLTNYPKVIFTETINFENQFVADKAMLITILQNLIANAINYADLSKEKPEINFYAKRINGDIQIIVEDNGAGIAKIYQEKIFDMFFRAIETSKGTGLGLFIVRNAVERLNGKIELVSELEKGTKFIVTIPAYPEYPSVN